MTISLGSENLVSSCSTISSPAYPSAPQPLKVRLFPTFYLQGGERVSSLTSLTPN